MGQGDDRLSHTPNAIIALYTAVEGKEVKLCGRHEDGVN